MSCDDIFCDGGELPIPNFAVPLPSFAPISIGGNVGGGGGGGAVNCAAFVTAWQQTCALTKTNCPGRMCDTCPGAIDASVRSCCNADLPVTCFQTALYGSSGNGAPITAPATTQDPNQSSCASAYASLSSCEAATSGFDSLGNQQQASCLCYDASGNADPSNFDGPFSACAAWAQTADQSNLSFFTNNLGYCASALSSAGSSGATATGTAMGTGAGTAMSTGASTAATGASAGSTTPTATPATTVAVSSSTASAAGSSSGTSKSLAASFQLNPYLGLWSLLSLIATTAAVCL